LTGGAAASGRELWSWPALVVVLGAFGAQSVLSARSMNASSDETSHLPAGYTYLKTGDFRLNPEHPPLIKELCALPLLALGPRLNLDDPAWNMTPPRQIPFGNRFLYGNDADRLLFWGRLPVVALSLVLGLYVFLWARDLHGAPAGLMAALLFAFCPNLLAHSHFVTMDVGLGCFMLVTLRHLWRWCREGSRPRDLVLAGLGLGAALATKFSGAVLAAVVPVLVALAAPRRGIARRWEMSRHPVGALAVLFAVAGLCVWAVYFFPSDPLFYWNGVQRMRANQAPYYHYYLLGEFRQGGWWYYPLAAFVLKTPLPTLILLVWSLVLAVRRRRGSADRLAGAFLALPALTFTAATCAFADNLGIRYLLPVFPLIFVFVSGLAGRFAASRGAALVGLVLALWYAGSTLRIYPDHLAYFNELAGGPERGHELLDDSNVEWGQDLKRLKAYLERRGIPRIKLLYWWNADPSYYGLPWEPVKPQEWRGRPSPGLYAISTQALIRGELNHRLSGEPTDWLRRYGPVDRVGYSFYLFRFE
jgi:hypothetical protein